MKGQIQALPYGRATAPLNVKAESSRDATGPLGFWLDRAIIAALFLLVIAALGPANLTPKRCSCLALAPETHYFEDEKGCDKIEYN